MSGPPHHSHNRQPPPGNPAWNHLQVPNFFPRQPQHAHMSNEHHLSLHQPTWHTPTTEPMKTIALPHVFNLDQMLNERSYRAGVDLTLTRNGNQNGDVPTGPISLSVRDTNKINSLPPGALGIQGVELTKSLSPGLKSLSPGLKSSSPGLKSNSPGLKSSSPGLKSSSPGLKSNSPGLKSTSPGLKSTSPGLKSTSPGLKSTSPGLKSTSPGLKSTSPGLKSTSPGLKSNSPGLKSNSPGLKSNSPGLIKPMSPLSSSPGLQDSPKNTNKKKRMDTVLEKLNPTVDKSEDKEIEKDKLEKPLSVLVQGSNDENSNSSSIVNAPTPTNDELVSPYSNEDSLDSNKSRRKRKPSKTVRVTKEPEKIEEKETEIPAQTDDTVDGKNEKVENEVEGVPAKKARRKTSSESETIEKIASMVQEVVQESQQEDNSQVKEIHESNEKNDVKICQSENENKNNEKIEGVNEIKAPIGMVTAAQRKATNFVEVENKLEEMFAGIVEDPPKIEDDIANKEEQPVELTPTLPIETDEITSTNENVSLEDDLCKTPIKKGKSPAAKRRTNTPKKKKGSKAAKVPKSSKKDKKSINGKIEVIKDVYAYDSGSNASSVKSRGPFVHIEGTRDSPVSVSIINTPTEEENDKKNNKLKKFHDDSEYRHKVRSKGLHCSTLSNKYDAQTKDVSWICVFCKRGPHSTDVTLSVTNQFYPPGDLFGPYVITNNCAEFERKLDDPYDKQFKSKKIARVLDAQVTGALATPKNSKKSKRKQSESERLGGGGDQHDDFLLGITATSEKTFEIWTHEDCVVWSPGVYLVGPKIVGLEEAVWTSCNVICVKCGYKGANLCCLRRGCTNVVHFGCGVVSDWALDYDSFRAYCVEHKSKC